MSGGAAKRPRRDCTEVAIYSAHGAKKPAMAADALATVFLRFRVNVSSYVCVPGVGKPICVANFDGNPGGKWKKLLFPRTADLQAIESGVKVLFCHGSARVETEGGGMPPYIVFHNPLGVDVDGRTLEAAPPASEVWACGTSDEGAKTYKKPRDGVTLSEVVAGSQLVLLFCCYSTDIICDYGREDRERQNPAFLVFLRDAEVWDTSIHIFTAMLMRAVETKGVKKPPFSECLKRNICQVLLWVQEHGSGADAADAADAFWDFLVQEKLVEMKPHVGSFCVQYMAAAIALSTSTVTAPQFKQKLLEEVQSVTLMIWVFDVDANGNGSGSYKWIDHKHEKAELEAYRDGQKVMTGAQHAAGAAGARGPAWSDSFDDIPEAAALDALSVAALLTELRGLLGRAAGAGI